jgi:hypothetical protein
VYVHPPVKPPTVADVADADAVTARVLSAVLPRYGVTVYPVSALPPLPGGVHETVAERLPAIATTLVGALGTVAGVTEFETPAGPVPATLLAATSRVYAVPLLSPVMVVDLVEALTATGIPVLEPAWGVTV